MNFCRRLWQVVVCLLTVTGVGLAVLLPFGTLVSLGVVGLVLGTACGVGLHAHLNVQSAPGRYVVVACVWTTVSLVAFAGVVAFAGAVALLVVVLLAVTSPPAVRAVAARAPRATRRAQDAPSTAESVRPVPLPPGAPEPAQNLQELDAGELCWRWRTSFSALQHIAAPAGRLRLIETRAALLDEMARRNPQGFSCWLNEGARAASDPTRYFPSSQQKPPSSHHQTPKADH